MQHVINHLPPHLEIFEISGIEQINRQLRPKIPPMISRVGIFAAGMVVGALIVAVAVMLSF
jgi:hypothetical protein